MEKEGETLVRTTSTGAGVAAPTTTTKSTSNKVATIATITKPASTTKTIEPHHHNLNPQSLYSIHNQSQQNHAPLQSPPSPAITIGCCAIKRNPPRPPQEIYFESRGKCCKKLLRYNGYPNKVFLYPEEGWARSAASSYWTIATCRWRRNTCIVEEVAGSRKTSTHGRMVSAGPGSLLIIGTFKRRLPDPDFKLYLSSNISLADYNMGYCLTGTLERGCQKTNTFQTTHFAVIRRCWPSTDENNKS